MTSTLRDPRVAERCVLYGDGFRSISDVPCPTTSVPLIPMTAEYTLTVTERPSECVRYNTIHTPIGTFLCASPGPSSATPTTHPSTSGSHAVTISSATAFVPIVTAAPKAPVASKNGLAPGAVAGIAIGMLLIGFLVAGIVFFFLLRRQRSRNYASHPVNHLPPASYSSAPEKGPVVVASAVPTSIDNLLPQPEPDDAITGEVSKIRDNIKNHIRTFCHSAPLATGINEAALRDIALATGLSSSVLVNSLSDPTTRQETLRLIFAWVILSKSVGGSNANLLPGEVAGLSGRIIGTNTSPRHTILYSKWKTITGFLLQQGMGKNAQDADRGHVFARTIAELDSIVGLCVQGSLDDAQRRKNLEMILTRAANFAFLLFSQPGSFQFDFGSRQGGIRAFPALLQTIGDQGQVLTPPRLLFEGEVVVV